MNAAFTYPNVIPCVPGQRRTELFRSSVSTRMPTPDSVGGRNFPLPINAFAKGRRVSNRRIAHEVDERNASRPRARVVVGKENGRGC
ncbi:hypothetical protein AB4Y44_01360 [Paraburkholderia sp. BR10937]|uniref:hypothetical protein n=1 Tax=Paraburkholderia sp. BR10937 TaxID=3236994 RepID=UPI0034D19154